MLIGQMPYEWSAAPPPAPLCNTGGTLSKRSLNKNMPHFGIFFGVFRYKQKIVDRVLSYRSNGTEINWKPGPRSIRPGKTKPNTYLADGFPFCW